MEATGGETHEKTEIDRAIAIAADAIGDLMEFWNFKPSMGRVWTILYLSQRPLTAEEIGDLTGLSSGAVSMTLSELQLWGVVHRGRSEEGGRAKVYSPETDIWSLVTRVFRERELRKVRDAVERLEAAAAALQRHRSHRPEEVLRGRFVATRVEHLLELARTGERILGRLSTQGEIDLGPVREWIGAIRRRR